MTAAPNATPDRVVARRARHWHRLAGLAPALVVYLALGRPVLAQDPGAAPPAATPTPVRPADEFERGTPRRSVRGFLDASWAGDFERAMNYLDLRRLPPAARASEGPDLARDLETIISRTIWVDPELLSDAAEGTPNEGLPARRDLLGTIQTVKGPVQLLLERVPREDGTLIWKISSETVAKIPALYTAFGYGPLGELLPAALLEVHLFTLPLWQTIGLLLLLGLAYVGSWLLTTITVRIGRPLVARTQTLRDDQFLDAARAPLRVITGALLYYAGTLALALPIRVQAVIGSAGKILAVATSTWLALRLVDLIADQMAERLLARQRIAAVAMIPLGRRTTKLLLSALTALALLQNLGFNVTGLVAGLGIGGLAVALAAQETVKNFFGGVALIADQPVRVGDFCRFGDKMGVIEDISIWSTRVRTLERTVVSVPNAQFASMTLENFARRDRTWLTATVGLRYGIDPDQLRAVLAELQKMLAAHPKVYRDSARARFAGFGTALQVEISAYVLTSSRSEFLAIREDIFLQIMDVVKASGSAIVAS